MNIMCMDLGFKDKHKGMVELALKVTVVWNVTQQNQLQFPVVVKYLE